jgi:hypothetical protein
MYRSRVLIPILFCVFMTLKGNAVARQILSVRRGSGDSTIVTPVANIGMTESVNIIYCASFEIAWQSLRDSVFREPIILDKNFQWVNTLNESRVNRSIGREYVSAFSGFGRDRIDQRFKDDLLARFSVEYNAESFLPSDIYAFSFIRKQVDFYFTLYPIDSRDLLFNNKTKIKFFGLNAGRISLAYRKKIKIHDYRNADDFVVQVVARDERDEVYLAKVSPGKTLYDTYKNVMRKVAADNITFLEEKDQLGIPYIKFRTTKEFDEIKEAKIMNKGFGKFRFAKALQIIDFDLNETGVSVESSAEIDAVFGIPRKFEPRALNFDRPFLIIMKEKDADDPYLLLWIANADLMEKN